MAVWFCFLCGKIYIMTNDYEHKISRKRALELANYYLQERIHNGSNIKIIFEHAVHIFNVAKIAENIAKKTDGALDPDTAYVLGLLHDIGRIKDETVTKVPHGIEGYNYLKDNGYPDIAPICITHCFINKEFKLSDYPAYDANLLCGVQRYLRTIKYNDYDRLIQLADLFSRGKEIMSIQQRLDRNKSFYHIENMSYDKNAFALRDYMNHKYKINVEKIVAEIFDLSTKGQDKNIEFSPKPKLYSNRMNIKFNTI